jgi:hypothetical protein
MSSITCRLYTEVTEAVPRCLGSPLIVVVSVFIILLLSLKFTEAVSVMLNCYCLTFSVEITRVAAEPVSVFLVDTTAANSNSTDYGKCFWNSITDCGED